MQYKETAMNLLPLYEELIAKYRILIYSGDVDACVPYWGSEEVVLLSTILSHTFQCLCNALDFSLYFNFDFLSILLFSY